MAKGRISFSTIAILASLVTCSMAQEVGGNRPPEPAGVEQDAAPRLFLETRGFSTFIGSVEFSPDGRWLAATGLDGAVRIWDVPRRQLSATLRGYWGKGYDGLVTALAFSPDGRELVVGVQSPTVEGGIRVYDTAHFDRIAGLLPGHPNGGVWQLAFSADGRFLASAGFDNSITVWDWPKRKAILRETVQANIRYLGFPIEAPVVVALLERQPARVWSALHGKDRDSLTPAEAAAVHAGGLQGLNDDLARVGRMVDAMGRIPIPYQGKANLRSPSYRSGRVIMAGHGKEQNADRFWVGLWSINEPASLIGRVHLTTYSPSAVALSADGRYAAHADLLGNLALWETAGDQAEVPITGESRPIYSVEFDGSDRRLAFGTTPYPPGRWNLNHYAPLERTFDFKTRELAPIAARERTTKATTQGNRVLALAEETNPRRQFLGSARGGRWESRYGLPPLAKVWCYSFLHSQRPGFADPVLMGQLDSSLTCLDPTTMMVRRVFAGHLGAITDFSESSDGRLLATSSTDGTIRIWSLGDFRRLAHPDFDFYAGDGVVHYVVPGGSADRAGVRVGDRWLRMDGVDVAVLEDQLLQGQWTYRPGQRVKLEMERGGQPYAIAMALPETGDVVEPLLSLFIAKDGEWVVWTPQGYYDASLNGDRLIGWHVNRGRERAAEFYPAQKFRKTLHRPDIISRVLETGDVAQAVADLARPTGTIDMRRQDDFQKIEPPTVRILEPREGTTVRDSRATVKIEIRTPSRRPLRQVVIRAVQGGGATREVVRTEPPGPDEIQTIVRAIELFPGSNRIEAVAVDPVAESLPAAISLTCDAPAAPRDAPRVVVLAIGVSTFANPNINLEFPNLDARAFAEAWGRQQNRMYGEVVPRLLTDAQATKPNIEDGFEWLSRTAGPRDLAILFLASHGVLDEAGNYFLAPHEVNPERLFATGVPYTDLTPLANRVKGRLYVFVDTCHSAAIGRYEAAKGRANDSMRDLVSDFVGAYVFAASQPNESALEHPDWGHGAFTKAFLDIISDRQSDVDPADGFLSINELKSRLGPLVDRLTGGKQHVSSPEVIRPDFHLIKLGP